MGDYDNYPLLKAQVEERLDIHQGIQAGQGKLYLPCPCDRKKKASDEDFFYIQKEGIFECYAGKCGLKKYKGNCYDLAKEFGISIPSGNGAGLSKFHKDPTGLYHFKWHYRNEKGNILYTVCRKDVADGKTGEVRKKYHTYYLIEGNYISSWEVREKNIHKPEAILFNLPKVISSSKIIIVEGEKCADRLQKEMPDGWATTTNPHGAGKWKEEYNKHLVGKTVFIIPDNDEKGLNHAQQILSQNRNHPRIAMVFPEVLGINRGEDIFDWLEQGGGWKLGKGKSPSLESYLSKLEKEMAKVLQPSLGLAIETPEGLERLNKLTDKSTEHGSRLRFLRLFGETCRFVPNKGKNGQWYIWNGMVWERDREGKIYEIADKVVEEVWKEIIESKDSVETHALIAHWKSLKSHKKIKQLLQKVGEAIPICKEFEFFDAMPTFLACQNTYIDLTTCTPIEPDRLALITKQIPVDYESEALCPEWNAFLTRSQPDPEIRLLLQKIGGACLTGEVPYNHLFFLYGEKGGNGKSVFLDTILHVLGAYGVKAGNSLLDEKARENMDDLARLKGARLAIPQEIDRKAVLKANQAKDITGGDFIVGKFLYQDSIQFKIQATIITYGNHKPNIDASDGGLRRRIILIPWEQTFPPESPGYVDRATLEAKLKAEASGILNWMLEGLFALRADNWNFNPPKVVLDATQEYFEEEDRLGSFFEECLEADALVYNERNLSQIYRAYEYHTKENGGRPMSRKSLSKELERKQGLELYREGTQYRGLQGYKLNSEWKKRVVERIQSEDEF